MRKSIATVSMSGTLKEKLEAIAAARFDGYELFENDLLYFSGSPAEVAAIAAGLGLTCELYQPFRDSKALPIRCSSAISSAPSASSTSWPGSMRTSCSSARTRRPT